MIRIINAESFFHQFIECDLVYDCRNKLFYLAELCWTLPPKQYIIFIVRLREIVIKAPLEIAP